MISYAQNFEDVMLARAFPGSEPGFYIDVGAMDPEFHSVTKYFYDRGWCGVNVEPTPGFHEKLSRERTRDVNLCVAVGSERGQKLFHDSQGHGISTFRPHLARHFEGLQFSFRTRQVEVVPLREICARHCPGPIDFLKVDVEGTEKEVLESADWNVFRPRIVLVEAVAADTHTPCWDAWEPLLLDNGYLFAYFDGLNRFYVRREDQHLAECFRLPPNVLDRFVTHEVIRLRRLQGPANPKDRGGVPETSLWIRSEEDQDSVVWRRVLGISGRPRAILRAGWRAVSATLRRLKSRAAPSGR